MRPSIAAIKADHLHHRPNSLQNPGGLDVEQQIIQAALPRPTDPGSSSTLCLNLNLSVPSGTTPTSRIPVLVFIHGGGFFTEANWWPQYDTRRLVRLSIEQRSPVIVANIKYLFSSIYICAMYSDFQNNTKLIMIFVATDWAWRVS